MLLEISKVKLKTVEHMCHFSYEVWIKKQLNFNYFATN